jgi:hypothetical protein
MSIGTSIALQSVLGLPTAFSEEDWGKAIIVAPISNPPYKQYDSILINVRTLVRNFLNSLPSKELPFIKSDDVILSLIGEMMLCDEIIVGHTRGGLHRVFYTLDYDYVIKEYSSESIKKPNTEKQIHYAALEADCVYGLCNGQVPVDLRFYGKSIGDNFDKSLMLSHMPIDLLSRYQFDLLALVESHTGKIKTRNEWYTKFGSSNKEELINIPFTEATLKVFGDGQLISPQPISVRNQLLECSQKGNWIYSTSKDKMRSDINRYVQETTIRDQLLALF